MTQPLISGLDQSGYRSAAGVFAFQPLQLGQRGRRQGDGDVGVFFASLLARTAHSSGLAHAIVLSSKQQPTNMRCCDRAAISDWAGDFARPSLSLCPQHPTPDCFVSFKEVGVDQIVVTPAPRDFVAGENIITIQFVRVVMADRQRRIVVIECDAALVAGCECFLGHKTVLSSCCLAECLQRGLALVLGQLLNIVSSSCEQRVIRGCLGLLAIESSLAINSLGGGFSLKFSRPGFASGQSGAKVGDKFVYVRFVVAEELDLTDAKIGVATVVRDADARTIFDIEISAVPAETVGRERQFTNPHTAIRDHLADIGSSVEDFVAHVFNFLTGRASQSLPDTVSIRVESEAVNALSAWVENNLRGAVQ